jgi:hypothetical protein
MQSGMQSMLWPMEFPVYIVCLRLLPNVEQLRQRMRIRNAQRRCHTDLHGLPELLR